MRFGLIGWPVAHSLSPALHAAAYQHLGLDATYELVGTQCVDRALLSRFDGLSVTRPLKQEAVKLVDVLEPLAGATGVVNTVVNQAGITSGFNTDVFGIAQAIKATGRDRFERAVILGSRATAASAMAALGELGHPDITIVARTVGGPGTAWGPASRLGLTFTSIPWRLTARAREAVSCADLVISTVPAEADFPFDALPQDCVCLEAAYSAQSRLLKMGGLYVSGLQMLKFQALQQVSLFTGREVPLAVLDDALAGAVGGDVA